MSTSSSDSFRIGSDNDEEDSIQGSAVIGRYLGHIGTALKMAETISFEENVRGFRTRHDARNIVVTRGIDAYENGPGASSTSGNTVDLHALTEYHHLKHLHLSRVGLNGSFPSLLQLSTLQALDVSGSQFLRLDLDDLTALPNLKYLDCSSCRGIHRSFFGGFPPFGVIGNLSSLGHLGSKLEYLDITRCGRISGSLMDLTHFSCLKVLGLERTCVNGDIREIGPTHFPLLESLLIASTSIYGATCTIDNPDAGRHYSLARPCFATTCSRTAAYARYSWCSFPF